MINNMSSNGLNAAYMAMPSDYDDDASDSGHDESIPAPAPARFIASVPPSIPPLVLPSSTVPAVPPAVTTAMAPVFVTTAKERAFSQIANVLGMSQLALAVLAVAGYFDGYTIGWITVGLSSGSLIFSLAAISSSKKPGCLKDCQKIIAVVGAIISLIPGILGVTQVLTGTQVGWGLLLPGLIALGGCCCFACCSCCLGAAFLSSPSGLAAAATLAGGAPAPAAAAPGVPAPVVGAAASAAPASVPVPPLWVTNLLNALGQSAAVSVGPVVPPAPASTVPVVAGPTAPASIWDKFQVATDYDSDES